MQTRLDRILKLLGSLANGGCEDVASIARQLGVSRRTVFRDLEALRKARVKIRFDRPHQTYQIDHDNDAVALPRSEELGRPTKKDTLAPRPSDLAELIRLVYVNAIPQTLAQRRQAVRAADALLSGLRPEAQKSIRKLLSSLSLDKFEPTPKKTRETFDILTQAIANDQILSLGFRRSSNEPYKQWDTFPIRMKLNGDQWALESLIAEDHRSLRIHLDKIVAAGILENSSKTKLTDAGVDWENVDIEVL